MSQRAHLEIWLEGHTLHVKFPEAGHVVTIPLDKCSVECTMFGEPLARQRGWLILLDLLKQRTTSAPRTIGTKSAPVQYDIEGMLRALSRTSAQHDTTVSADLWD